MPNFHENWYSDGGCALIGELAQSVMGFEGRYVEVGCWEGKSTCALANAVKPQIIHAVDTWEGSPGEISEELARERDVEAQFRHNVHELTEGNILAYRMDWRSYLEDHPYPIKFLHIDALHTYDEVAEQLAKFTPLVVPGGLICGDDWQWPGVQQAVLEAFPDSYFNGHVWLYQVPHTMLEGEYRKAVRVPSDIHQHLPVMVRLCQELEATKVIELGTRGGVSTLAWLYGLEHVGRLWSVDIDPAPELPYDHWTFIQGSDLDRDVYRQLPDSADVVFIDTSHAYDQTLAELNLYLYKVRPGGRIVLHDTEVRHPRGLPRKPDFPVKRAVEEFCADEGLPWTNLPNCNGLGIIEIPE